jgi:anaerobic sulfite reductase subunit C
MVWDTDAEEALAQLPVPLIMQPYARIYAEKIARHRKSDRVTREMLVETEKAYAQFMGREKTEQLRAFLAGTGPPPALEDELFFTDNNVLYHIETCFTKYGENSDTVRTALKDMMRSVCAVLEEERVTDLMADLALGPIHGASRFTVGMTGCPNCCVSPYLKDFGIIMQHRVDITEAACVHCGACLPMCIEKAIQLTDRGPVINRAVCVQCELCSRDCPTGTLTVRERGWRVIAGGSGGRHPALAVLIEDFTTKQRVLTILRNAIARLRHAQPGESLRTILQTEGADALR